MKSATSDTITNSLRRVFVNHGVLKVIMSETSPSSLLLNLKTFISVVISPIFTSCLTSMV
ncbi:unnamed protein product [Hymenolepis diminuta]|uniref:Uncharacterized protein n=1 Tax=Hymenolepis diminuta TaxID=6216 RepID=A0A564YL76_HYMDI|nr:unnamed protein product [Hymenolepis diminuta]